jgi:hypothetical protein
MLKIVSSRDSYVSIRWTLKYSSKNRLKPFGHFNAHIVLCVMFQLRSVVFFSLFIHDTKLTLYFLRHVVMLFHSHSLLANNAITMWHVTNNQPSSNRARILHQIPLVHTRAAHRYTRVTTIDIQS